MLMHNNFWNPADTCFSSSEKIPANVYWLLFLQTQKVAQTLPQGLAPSVLPYRFTVSHYANGAVWHDCFCPLLTSCSKSNFEGLREFFSCWYTKEPSVWLLWNSVLYWGLSMSYSKICVKTNINSFPSESRTSILQFLVCLCPYMCVHVCVCVCFVYIRSFYSFCQWLAIVKMWTNSLHVFFNANWVGFGFLFMRHCVRVCVLSG